MTTTARPDPLDELPPNELAKMLLPDQLADWPESDGAAVLRHQLAAPLLPDLAIVPGAQLSRLEALMHHRPGTESFARQLAFITPSLELLDAIKQFAHHFRDDQASPLHGGPATVLYYAAIAAAVIRCNGTVTQLTNAQLGEGFAWAQEQPGAEELRHIFIAAITHIGAASHYNPS